MIDTARSNTFRGAHSSRVLVAKSRRNELFFVLPTLIKRSLYKINLHKQNIFLAFLAAFCKYQFNEPKCAQIQKTNRPFVSWQ